MIKILDMVVIIVMVFLGIYATVIIHELGHIVFGKLSGYEFVSYRVGSLMLLKKDGKFMWKKYTVPGTGGQALMRPVQKDPYHYPHVLLHLGGVIGNYAFMAIFVLLYSKYKDTNYLSYFLLAASISSLYVGTVNAIPLKIKGRPNDGYNTVMMIKDNEARRATWIEFQYYAMKTKGIRIKEMPKEWFILPKGADPSNPYMNSIDFNRCRYLRDIHDFNNAKLLCEKLLKNAPNMISLERNELMCDLMFYEMIGDCNTDKINGLYTEKLKKYISDTRFYISSIRLMYSYELLVNKNQAQSDKQLKLMKKAEKTYPYQGEIEGERELIGIIQRVKK